MDTDRAYLLDNAQAGAARRMQVLSRLYDATTQRALSAVGLGDGWRCLEVGGGGGSVARWMAERVAPTGSVLATDIDPRHMPASSHQNLRIERHDIVGDDLPAASYDLIHARLVLIHLPARDAVLARLVDALKPGGYLVIEDFDVLSMLPDASINPSEVPLATAAAVRVFMNRGISAHCGRLLHGQFRALGLREVSAEGRVLMFDTRNGGTELLRVNFEQIGAQLVAEKLVSEAQLRADIARLDGDDFAVPSPVMWTVTGRS